MELEGNKIFYTKYHEFVPEHLKVKESRDEIAIDFMAERIPAYVVGIPNITSWARENIFEIREKEKMEEEKMQISYF